MAAVALVVMLMPVSCTWTRLGDARHSTFLARTRVALPCVVGRDNPTSGAWAVVDSDPDGAIAALERAAAAVPSGLRDALLNRALETGASVR
jgi:hypothetical protein